MDCVWYFSIHTAAVSYRHHSVLGVPSYIFYTNFTDVTRLTCENRVIACPVKGKLLARTDFVVYVLCVQPTEIR
jgi:hypothetical protein